MNILNLATRGNSSRLAPSLHERLLTTLLLTFGRVTRNKSILKRVLLLRFGAVSPTQVTYRRRRFIRGYRAKPILPNTAAGSSSSRAAVLESGHATAASTLVRQLENNSFG